MSADSTTSSPQRAPGFLWILGAFAGFALAAMIFQGLFGQERTDPREPDRRANLSDIQAIQFANVKKMGLEVGKSSERLAKSLEVLKTQAPKVSAMLVPGSPTQLKQSAAAAPAPAPAAPGSAPAPAAPAATPPAAPPAAPAPAAAPAK